MSARSTSRRLAVFGLALVVAAAAAAFAQSPPQVTAAQVRFPLAVGLPAPVAAASISRTGQPGPGAYYYWIVSNYAIGSTAPAGPFLAPGA
ncbi:MAG TPA: hypothetical protein VE998_02010, partial [Terriglobales bacterium]|nr:hypothetical protein [Terriglobales bacterium]